MRRVAWVDRSSLGGTLGLARHDRQATDRRHAQIDDDGFAIPQGISEELLVADMEGFGDLGGEIPRVPINVIEGNADLENLLAIAHVGGALEAHLVAEGWPETAAALGFHLGIERAQALRLQGTGIGKVRAAESRCAHRSSACPTRTRQTRRAARSRG